MSQRFSPFLLIFLVLVLPTALVLGMTTDRFVDVMLFFPAVVNLCWIAGALAFWLRRERSGRQTSVTMPHPAPTPLVSILVLCQDNRAHPEDALRYALAQHYPEIEVIAVMPDHDRSRADAASTPTLPEDARLRVVRLIGTTSPAMALQMGVLAASGDYLVCVEGDARLAPDAVTHLMTPLLASPEVGAVTGNTRIPCRASLAGWIQASECAAITGMAQRTQALSAHLGPLTGVTAFRRTALDSVGYWEATNACPDIDLSWRLRRARWASVYQPQALCWQSVPGSVCTVQKLRVTRAMGHADALFTHAGDLGRWSQRHMWAPLLALMLWLGWASTMALATGLWVLGYLMPLPAWARITTLLPSSHTALWMATISVLLSVTGILVTHRYEPRLWRRLVWLVWYPLLFWPLNLAAAWISLPGALLRQRTRASH